MKKNELLRGVTAKPMTDADKTRIEKLTWTFERDTHSTAYHFYKHNDFKFKAGINNPQWLCDLLNTSEELAAYKEKLKQERNKAIDECISDLKNKVTKTSLTWKLADELESLKSKPE